MATIRLDIFIRSTLDDLFFYDFDSWCFDERFWVFFSFRNWPQRFDEFSYIFVNSLNCSQTFLTNDNLTYFLWRMKMVFSAKKSSECRTFGDSVCEFITYDKIQFSFFGFHYASLNLFTFSQFAYALAWARFLSRWLRVSWAKLAKISAVAILVFDSKRYLYLTVSYFFRWRSRTKQSENTNNSALEPIPTISQFRLFCSRFLSRFGS